MSDSSCLLFVNNKNRESPNWSSIIHDKRLFLTEDICLHSYVFLTFLPEHYIDNLHFLSTLCDRSTVSVTSHHCFAWRKKQGWLAVENLNIIFVQYILSSFCCSVDLSCFNCFKFSLLLLIFLYIEFIFSFWFWDLQWGIKISTIPFVWFQK